MYAITGATGHLGQLVIATLLKQKVAPGQIIAIARDPAKASDLAAKGLVVRKADYNQPATLGPALQGADKVLLISGNEVGRRVPQHKAVIDAAKTAKVKLLAYTSALHANNTSLELAAEHRETEALLKASGLAHVLLRNGWYTENYTGSIAAVLQHGVLIGCSGEGRISAATRPDFAEAAAAVLVAQDQAGRTYELAGDEAFTRADLAAEISRQSGKKINNVNLTEADYKAALVSAGLPEPIAGALAQSDTATAQGALFDDSHQLSKLIGRPTTPLKDAIAAALKA
jgi:NAD(P)H dehydrogenase (quinone)